MAADTVQETDNDDNIRMLERGPARVELFLPGNVP